MKALRKLYRKIQDKLLAPLCAKAEWSSALYYGLFSERFRREAHAVLVSRLRHAGDDGVSYARISRLRRNVHRLEKGLIAPNPKLVFARDYIAPTVDAFEKERAEGRMDAASLKWCHDVLAAYFDRIKTADAVVDKARARFAALGGAGSEDGTGGAKEALVPYARRDSAKSEVGYADFMALCRRRRSVRHFTGRSVERSRVDEAILAALQAPSACNRQPFVFRCFDEADKVRRLASLPPGANGFPIAPPVLVALVGDVSAYAEERDRHLIYIDGSLAAMQFMLALETLGLASCAVNWPDIAETDEALAKELGLAVHQRCVMFIAVGEAEESGMIPYSQKKDLERARSYNL